MSFVTDIRNIRPYPQAILADNPLLYWQLNDSIGSLTVLDSSPNQLNGTVGSALTLGSQGVVASDSRTACLSPTSGPYSATKLISSPQSSLIQPTAAVTVEWVGRLIALPSANLEWVSIGANTSLTIAGIFAYPTSTGVLEFGLSSTGLVASSSLLTGVTYHIALTYNGSTASIYLNGVLNASVALSGPISGYDGIHGLVIGDVYTARTSSLNAVTQDVAIYGYALSPASIERHSAIAFGAQTYAQAVLLAQPALYWPLGDAYGSTTVKDFGPNGLNGTVGSALTLGSTALVPGDTTTSLLVPGGSGAATKYVQSPYSTIVQPTVDVTVEFIGQLLALPSSATGWVSCGANASGTNNGYAVQLTSAGALYFDIDTGSVQVTAASSLIIGVTYHIVATYDGLVLRLYINGVLNNSLAHTGTITGYSGTNSVDIGSTYLPSAAPNILTQHVAIYTSALSPATIASHAAIALGTNAVYPTPYQQAVLAAKPTLYWPLNDGIGASTVADWSPNNLTGTVGSAVTLGSTGLVGSDARTSATLPGGAYAATKLISSARSVLIEPSTFISIEFVGRVVALPVAANANWLSIGGTSSASTVGPYVLLENTGVLDFVVGGSALVKLTPTVGNTYHFAITFDGAMFRLYVNGVLTASTAYAGAITGYSGTTGLILGEYYSGRVTTPNVITQDVAVYAGSVLSPSTIAAHYAIFQGGAYTVPAAQIPPSYNAAVLQDNPVGYWPLDDSTSASTITDLSGNNISGIWPTGVTRNVTGLVATNPSDPATSFPAGSYAANKVLTMTTGPISLLQPTTSFSCDFVLKVAAMPTGNNQLIGMSNGAGSVYPYDLYLTSTGALATILNTAGTAQNGTAAGVIVPGTTYHIALTYNSVNVIIYINGVQAATGAYTATLTGYSTVNAPFAIGEQYTGRTGEAAYTIGQVAFYAQALTAARVLGHYKAATTLNLETLPSKTENALVTDIVNSITWNLGLPVDTRAPFSDSIFIEGGVDYVLATDTRLARTDSAIFLGTSVLDVRAAFSDAPNCWNTQHVFVTDTRASFSDYGLISHVDSFYVIDTRVSFSDSALVKSTRCLATDTRTVFYDSVILLLTHYLIPIEPGITLLDSPFVQDVQTQMPVDTRYPFSDYLLLLPILHSLSVTDVASSHSDSYLFTNNLNIILHDTRIGFSDIARCYNASFDVTDTRAPFSDDNIRPLWNSSFMEVQRAYGYTDGLSGTVAVNLGYVPTPGNLLVAFSVGTVNPTPPSGWNLVASVQGAVVEGSTYANSVAFEHRVVAGDVSLTNFNTTIIGGSTPGQRWPTCIAVLEYQYADSVITYSPTAACTFSNGQVSGLTANITIPDSTVIALFPLYVPDFATYSIGGETIDSNFTTDLAQYSNESGYGNNMFLVGHVNHLAAPQTVSPIAYFPGASIYTNPNQSAFLLVITPIFTAINVVDTRSTFTDVILHMVPPHISATDTRAVTSDSQAYFSPIDWLPPKSESVICINGILVTEIITAQDTRTGFSDSIYFACIDAISPIDTRATFSDVIGIDFVIAIDTRPTFSDQVFFTKFIIVIDDFVGLGNDYPSIIDSYSPIDTRATTSDDALLSFIDYINVVEPYVGIFFDTPATPVVRNVAIEDDWGQYGADFAFFSRFPAYQVEDDRGEPVSDVPILLLYYTIFIEDDRDPFSDVSATYLGTPLITALEDTRQPISDIASLQHTAYWLPTAVDTRADVTDVPVLSEIFTYSVTDIRVTIGDYPAILAFIEGGSLPGAYDFRIFSDWAILRDIRPTTNHFINVTDKLVRTF